MAAVLRRSLSSKALPLNGHAQAIAREWLKTLPRLAIPAQAIALTYTRSSGSGGQHVNKTSSKAVARLAVTQEWLPGYVHSALRDDAHYVRSSDSIVVADSTSRSASHNAKCAAARIEQIIKEASSRGVQGDTAPGKAERVEGFKRKEKTGMERRKKMHKEKKQLRRVDRE